MPVVINLSKSDSSIPWGFRLHGGKDFGAPLTVQRINPGSVVAKCGLLIGDAISIIDSVPTSGLKHKEAQDLIVKGGNNLKLTICRGDEIQIRQVEASQPFTLGTFEKDTFRQSDGLSTPDYSLSSQVESLSISNESTKPQIPIYSSLAAPYRAPSAAPAPTISSKNAPLYQPSLQIVTSGLTKNHHNFDDDNDDFPPPPPNPSAVSPIQTSFPPASITRPHQPIQKFPDVTVTNETNSGTNTPDQSQYVPSETYKLVRDMEAGLEVPFNPRTGAGVRSSPIQSKLVDILEKKHATIGIEKLQDGLVRRPVSPQNTIHTAPKNANYGGPNSAIHTFRKGNQPVVPASKFLGGNASAPRGLSPTPQPPSKASAIDNLDPGAIPVCNVCNQAVRGAYVMAINKIWCPDHFICSHSSCNKNLSETGFVEEQGQLYCKDDYEKYFAPRCVKCNRGIVGNTVKALKATYHPECFTCHQCNQSIMGGSFHLHEGQIYCDKDFSAMFSAKCVGCNFPIEVGDNWIDAAGTNWHGECFNCTVCRINLQNIGFVHRDGRFLCRDHAK